MDGEELDARRPDHLEGGARSDAALALRAPPAEELEARTDAVDGASGARAEGAVVAAGGGATDRGATARERGAGAAQGVVPDGAGDGGEPVGGAATAVAAHAAPTGTVAGEARAVLRLAGPIVVAQVGLLGMGLVDTWMVGRLGAAELAAVALADASFFTFVVIAMGLVQALDPLVGQAYGAGDRARAANHARGGRLAALAVSLPLTALVVALGPLLAAAGAFEPRVTDLAHEYLLARAAGVLPWLLYAADRSFLNGIGVTSPAMAITLGANVLNALLDWALIFGHWGAPALGVAGSGWATSACSLAMFLALRLWIARRPAWRAWRDGGRASPERLRLLVRVGAPIGLAHGLEVGAFAGASFVVGHLGTAALAGHQIAIKMASTSFMVAIALGVATGVRVAHAVGAGRTADVRRAGWVGMGLGATWMVVAAGLFLTLRGAIAGSFADDPVVVAAGASLLAIAGAFQLSDGLQAIASGALRGLGDTRWPLFANLVAHWCVGLPLGALFGLGLGWGPEGVWWALALGLTAAAALLIARFHVASRRARALEGP